MENKQLPDELKKDLDRINEVVREWSRFVAWSWTDFLAYRDKPEAQDLKKAAQEKELKKFFIKIFQDQARYSYTVSSYGDPKKKQNAYAASIKIKKLVMSRNDEIQELIETEAGTGVTLTLSDVYETLTGQRPTIFSNQEFMQMFHVEIVTDRFSGYVRDILFSEKDDIKKFTSQEDLKYVENVQYISYLAYPPCPVFGETRVTEDQLKKWSQGQNEAGESITEYLPPSAYIPISFT